MIAKSITSALFLCIFLLVSIGIYSFFSISFRYLGVIIEDDMRGPLTLFIYEMFLAVLLLLMVISVLISGVFSLFRGEGDTFVMSSPSSLVLLERVFMRSLAGAAVPLFVMCVPALLAVGRVYQVPLLSLLVPCIGMGFFLLVVVAFTLTWLVVVGRLFLAVIKKWFHRPLRMREFIVALFLFVAGGVCGIWRSVRHVDLVKVFRAEDVDTVASLHVVGDHFMLLPTHPFALLLIAWQGKGTGDMMKYLFVLFLMALVTSALFFVTRSWFESLWVTFQENSNGSNGVTKVKKGYRFGGSLSRALFTKELLLFTRDMKGLAWFLFLIAVWVAQVLATTVSSRNARAYQENLLDRMQVIWSVETLVALFFMAAFALRFVFTAASVEKKTSWILGSAPVSKVKQLFGKYSFFVVLFGVVLLITEYVNGRILHIPFLSFTSIMLVLMAGTLGVVTLAFTLGTFFPNDETDDPEIIATSIPGLLFTALALLYSGLGAYSVYLVVAKEITVLLVLFVTVSLLLTVWLLRITYLFLTRSSLART